MADHIRDQPMSPCGVWCGLAVSSAHGLNEPGSCGESSYIVWKPLVRPLASPTLESVRVNCIP